MATADSLSPDKSSGTPAGNSAQRAVIGKPPHPHALRHYAAHLLESAGVLY
jgi:site-specific recombinase XerC